MHAWFITLGDTFVGREPTSEAGDTAWRVLSRFGELRLTVDRSFPYSRASIYCKALNQPNRDPHVEASGKLCLGSPVDPHDPVGSVRTALNDALTLIKENVHKKHGDDFLDDFALYWNYDLSTPYCGLLITDYGRSSLGCWYDYQARKFVFDDARAGAAWMTHRFGVVTKPRQAGVIAVSPLPPPSRYPQTAAELWTLVDRHSSDGCEILQSLLANLPKTTLVAIVGVAPSGRRHGAVVQLDRPISNTGKQLRRKDMIAHTGNAHRNPERTCASYTQRRIMTRRLDAAVTRLPDPSGLSYKRVAIVGCGALGSGVASLLAKTGVGTLVLVDGEEVGWENIKRHQLGAESVGLNKAQALACAIKRSIPDLKDVTAVPKSIQAAVRNAPRLLAQCDLAVSCTGDWLADVFIEDCTRTKSVATPIVYGWLEAHGLAAHAVLISSDKCSLRDGFDASGRFQFAASNAPEADIVPECGLSTTPFGAIELSHAQTLVARLAIDTLRSNAAAGEWRTWLTDAETLRQAGAAWREDWCQRFGTPPSVGGTTNSQWIFE